MNLLVCDSELDAIEKLETENAKLWADRVELQRTHALYREANTRLRGELEVVKSNNETLHQKLQEAYAENAKLWDDLARKQRAWDQLSEIQRDQCWELRRVSVENEALRKELDLIRELAELRGNDREALVQKLDEAYAEIDVLKYGGNPSTDMFAQMDALSAEQIERDLRRNG